MAKRNYKLTLEQAQAISEARSGNDFEIVFTKRSNMAGKEILIMGYSHQPAPVSQYHNQPREFRVAIFRDANRVADWAVA